MPSWLTLKVALWLGIAVLLGLVVAGTVHKVRVEERRALQLEQLKEDLLIQRKAADAANKVLSERVVSKARIQTITKEIIREVPVRIAADACSLDDGWRVLHDAAASGSLPAAPTGADAAPTESPGAAQHGPPDATAGS